MSTTGAEMSTSGARRDEHDKSSGVARGLRMRVAADAVSGVGSWPTVLLVLTLRPSSGMLHDSVGVLLYWTGGAVDLVAWGAVGSDGLGGCHFSSSRPRREGTEAASGQT